MYNNSQGASGAKQYALAKLKSLASHRQLTSLSTTRLHQLRYGHLVPVLFRCMCCVSGQTISKKTNANQTKE